MTRVRTPALRRLPYALIVYFGSCFVSGELRDAQKSYLAGFEIESDIGRVLSVSGHTASLPCNITAPIVDDNVTLVLWYKGHSEKPIYGYDARIEGDTIPEHFVHRTLETRARFTLSTSPAILEIMEVKEEDAGAYRCRVDFFKSRTVHYKVTLVVTVPPRKPIIMDENGQSMKGRVGPFNEGSNLNLVCEVEGGKPKPVVKWWRESELVSTKSEVGRGGVIRSELVIHSLARTELHVKYTCEANNNNVTQPPSTDIIIDMNFKPKEVRITTPKDPLSAGKSRKLTCESWGSRPPAVMTWWKGSRKMKLSEEVVSEDEMRTSSVVVIMPKSGDSGTYLSCRADNPTIPASALEDGWKLKIYYKPELTLKIDGKQSSESHVEGSDVYLLCSIRAEPWVTDIRWLLNGRQLPNKKKATETTTNDATLHLQDVGRQDRGSYRCTASNEEGQGRSNLVQLNIKHKPICKSDLKKVYVVSRMEAARVVCQVEADPDTVTFRWTYNRTGGGKGDGGYKVLSSYTTLGTTSVASFMPTDQNDHGTLSCWATNYIGRQQRPCVFNLVFAGPPDQVRNCSITNQTDSMLEVRCSPGSDGGLRQVFVVEVYDMSSHRSKFNMTSERPTFVISGLEADHTFTVIVSASNEKGRSRSYQMVARTLQHPLKRTGNNQGTAEFTSLPLLVVIVVLLVVVAFVIVLLMRKRQLRQRRQSQEKKSQSPEIRRTPNHLLGTTIDQDFQQYDVKGPDIIPARNSSKEAGFENYAVDDRLVKRFNNIRDVLYENDVYDKNSSRAKISCISDSPKSTGEVHYAELSLPSNMGHKTSQPPQPTASGRPPTEYATIDFNKTGVKNKDDDCSSLSVGLMLKPPVVDLGDEETNVTAETPLMYNQLESSV